MKYLDIQKTVIEYLNEKFTSPFYIKTNEYEIGTVLYTANPYARTNATIVDIEDEMFVILTDIGNILKEPKHMLEKTYLPPVAKRTNTIPLKVSDYFKAPSW